MIAGKLVRPEQPYQAKEKLPPLEMSIKGKPVRLEQPYQAPKKLVPLEVSIKGKLVRLVQLRQALVKLVTPVVTPKAALNLVILFAPNQAFPMSVPKLMSAVWISVIRSSSPLLLKNGRYTTADVILMM